jgi:hypothetical protein
MYNYFLDVDTGGLLVVDTFRARYLHFIKRLNQFWEYYQFFSSRYRYCRTAFVTLTFASGFDKTCISTYIMRLRKSRKGKLVAYVWVLERGQEGGRLHYHVYLIYRGSLPLSRSWTWGFVRVIRDFRNPFYVVKYFSKYGVEDIPSGSRMFAVVIPRGFAVPKPKVAGRYKYLFSDDDLINFEEYFKNRLTFSENVL